MVEKHDKFCAKGKRGQFWDMSCSCQLIAQVRRNQTKRIIKLLEPRLAAMGSDYCMCHTISRAAIRLIKDANQC
jgi:hypothetical protein